MSEKSCWLGYKGNSYVMGFIPPMHKVSKYPGNKNEKVGVSVAGTIIQASRMPNQELLEGKLIFDRLLKPA